MSRLEAVKKCLYYPTQENVLRRIASHVEFWNPPGWDATNGYRQGSLALDGLGGGSLIDPCAGEGDAASFLAWAWNVGHTTGIELHEERALKAAEKLSNCAVGKSYSDIAPLKEYSILFLNPPYDTIAKVEDERCLRQEVVFLEYCTSFLCAGGLLIYIPPKSILGNENLKRCLKNNYERVACFDYPEPERSEFNQCVILAIKTQPGRNSGYYSYTHDEGLVPIGVIGDSKYKVNLTNNSYAYYAKADSKPLKEIKGMSNKELLKANITRPVAPSLSTKSGAYGHSRWFALTNNAGSKDVPLMLPRPGHQAMLLAAGYLNGMEVNRKLIKGGSSKIKNVSEYNGKVVERDTIVSHLSVLDLDTCEFDTWETTKDPEKTEQWFKQNSDLLSQSILGSVKPSYTGDGSELSHTFSKYTPPGKLPGHSEPEFLPVQKQAVGAILHRWKTAKSCILSGEMGTGKTTIATLCGAIQNYSKKVVVVCPTHLVKKWIREISTITGDRNAAKTAKTLSEVDRFFASKSKFLVLSKESAKLGSKWSHATIVKKQLVDVVKYNRYTHVHEAVGQESVDVHYCTKCKQQVIDFNDKKQNSCKSFIDNNNKCGEILWQVTPLNSKGTKRWPLARYINQRYSNSYMTILDEAHMFSRSDSDQAQAAHSLMAGAVKILAMTGTLYGGRASSIFHLLYRVEKSFRECYKHNDVRKFVESHGLFEASFPIEDYASMSSWKRKKGVIKEIPGMNPAMIPMLLPFTVFVKLKDLGVDLPPYSEEVVLIHPPQTVTIECERMQKDMVDNFRKNKDTLSKFLMALLGYPDLPEHGEVIDSKYNGVVSRAAPFVAASLPKDDEVLRICKEEREQGRGVCVFFSQTHRRDARPRVKKILEDNGFKVAVLDANIAANKREEWLMKEADKGFDVLLTNGRLVETGLDLLFAHTMIQYGVEYSINSLRQYIRRSWRLGQEKPVKIYFLAYLGTMQERATDLIARKMRAAELVDGDEVGGLAEHDEIGYDFLVEIARESLGLK